MASSARTIGGFVAFNMYVSLYEQGFSALANMYMSLAETLISIGRFLQNSLEREPAIAFGVGDGRLHLRAAPSSCADALDLFPARARRAGAQGFLFVATPGTVVLSSARAAPASRTVVGRLLERFYDPQGGALLLDGVDFRKLELRWLRRQIGLVEKENEGWRRLRRVSNTSRSPRRARSVAHPHPAPPLPSTVPRRHDDRREHRIRAPGAPLADVRGAARLANAEGFILQMDGGYAISRRAYVGRSGAQPAPPPPPPSSSDPIGLVAATCTTRAPARRAARASGGQICDASVAIARAVLKDCCSTRRRPRSCGERGGRQCGRRSTMWGMHVGRRPWVIAHRESTVVRATQIIVLDRASPYDARLKPPDSYATSCGTSVGEDTK